MSLLLALGVSLAVLAPAASQAGDSSPRYWKRCEYCGGAIYRRHLVIDRTSHGKAVKYWQVLPHQCGGGGYGYGGGYGGGYRGGYNCPPGHHHHGPGYGYGGRVGIPFPGFFFGR